MSCEEKKSASAANKPRIRGVQNQQSGPPFRVVCGKIADLVEPVPHAVVQEYPSEQQDAVRRNYRVLSRFSRQQQELASAVRAQEPRFVEGGEVIRLPRGMRTPQRPATATSARSVPVRPGRAGGDKTPRVFVALTDEEGSDGSMVIAASASSVVVPPPRRVHVPGPLKGCKETAIQREALANTGHFDEAMRLLRTPAGSAAQLANASNSARSLREAGREAQSAYSPTESIGALYSRTLVRMYTREKRMEPVRVAVSHRTGPAPAPAIPLPSHDGVLGRDPALSHFLDLNDYDDAPIPDIAEGQPGCIAWCRYYSSPSGGLNDSANAASSTGPEVVMEPCKILSANPSRHTLTIRWIRGGKTKEVKSLSVKYHYESDTAYQDRLARAEQQRHEDELLLRFVRYANSIPKSEVHPMPEPLLKRILELVSQRFPKRHLPTVERCLSEIEDVWYYAIKRAIVIYKMRDHSTRQKIVEQLVFDVPQQFLVVEPHDLVGLCSTIPLLEAPRGATPSERNAAKEFNEKYREVFATRRAFIRTELFMAHEQMYRVQRFLATRWNQFANELLIQVDAPNDSPKPPQEVVDFRRLQRDRAELVAHNLVKDWLESAIQALQTELCETLDFFEDDASRFAESRANRYLRQINLILGGQLQELVYSSVNAMKSFVQSFRIPEATMQVIRAEGMGHDRQGPGFLRAIGFVAQLSVVPPPFRRAAAQAVPEEPFGTPPSLADLPFFRRMGNFHTTSDSLLVVRLTVDGTGRVILHPPLEEVREVIEGMFSDIFSNTDGIRGLGPQLFPLISADPPVLTATPALYRSTDPVVQSCSEAIKAVLQENFLGPTALLRLYQPFEYVLKQTPEEYLNDFLTTGREPKREDYDTVCSRLTQHLEALQYRSFNDISFPLLKVETHLAKKRISDRLLETRRLLLQALHATIGKEIARIDAESRSIFERLQVEPSNPEELRDLRLYLDTVGNQMQTLSLDMDALARNIALLQKFGVDLDAPSFKLYWFACEWPRKIELLLDDAPFRLQSFRAFFVSEMFTRAEVIRREIHEVQRKVEELSTMDDETFYDVALANVNEIGAQISSLNSRSAVLNRHEQIFQQHMTKWTLLKELEEQFEPYSALWTVTSESHLIDSWLESYLEQLKPEEIVTLTSKWKNQITKLAKVLADEPPIDVVRVVQARLDQFQKSIPLIVALAKPSLLERKRHMNRIGEIIGIEKFDLRNRTLQNILKLELPIPAMHELSEIADEEHRLESQLSKMKQEWHKVAFKFEPYNATFLLRDTDDIRVMMDEAIVKAETMLASPFVAAVINELRPWERKLQHMSMILEEWIRCQRGYRYLSPVFAQENVTKSLPEEAQLFETLSSQWFNLMEQAQKVPLVLSRLSEEKLAHLFPEMNAKLDRITRELSKLLDAKRMTFPRFYFVSDEMLIDIIAEASAPPQVQRYLPSIFAGINHLTFNADGSVTHVLAAGDPEGQGLPLPSVVDPTESECIVEKWLAVLESAMKAAVFGAISRCFDEITADGAQIAECAFAWQGQIISCAADLYWTALVERAIAGSSLQRTGLALSNDLQAMVKKTMGDTCTATQRKKIQAITLSGQHWRDIIDFLASNAVTSVEGYEWVMQMRYYWNAASRPDRQSIMVRQLLASLPYGCEYLGAPTRLVMAPLVDRYFRAMTMARQCNIGGALAGPPGAGKTELVKDLSKALAKMCITFDCGETLCEVEMAKYLRGMASSGQWVCLDNVTRISASVLSILAQQLHVVQTAALRRSSDFILDGRECTLREGGSIFATLGLTDASSRQRLPPAFTSVFRSLAVVAPQADIVLEALLFSYGFTTTARLLAQKIVTAHRLCGDLLQAHQGSDLTLRSMKTVAAAAGEELIRFYSSPRSVRSDEEDEEERALRFVAQALVRVHEPRMPGPETEALYHIVSYVCRQRDPLPSDAVTDELEKFFPPAAASEGNLQLIPNFSRKLKQLFDSLCAHSGVIVLGSSPSGKTATVNTLARALSAAASGAQSPLLLKYASKVVVDLIFPRAVTAGELYGRRGDDASGGEWQYGILSSVLRTAAAASSRDETRWITLDGPLENDWCTEPLKSVLDDAGALSLANRDIIRRSTSVKLIFITDGIQQASPAFVSRCGLVFCDSKELGWPPLVAAWLKSLPEPLSARTSCVNALATMVNSVMPRIADLANYQQLESYGTVESLCGSLLKLLDALVRYYLACADAASAAENDLLGYAEGLFLFALTNSIGVLAKERDRFVIWLRETVDTDTRSRSVAYSLSVSYPDPLFEYAFSIPPRLLGDLRWVKWAEILSAPTSASFVASAFSHPSSVVLTPEMISAAGFARLAFRLRLSPLLIGLPGSGKTTILQYALSQLEPKHYTNGYVLCHAGSTATTLRLAIEQNIERRGGARRFGPPVGKNLIFVIDDLGMARDTCSPYEFMREVFSCGGWRTADQQRSIFIQIVNVTLAAAMLPLKARSCSEASVTPRLLKHFCPLVVPTFSPTTMKVVLTELLMDSIHNDDLRGAISGFLTDLHFKVTRLFPPSIGKWHYMFTPRNVFQIVEGIRAATESEPYDAEARGENELIALVCHECRRGFVDRFSFADDRSTFAMAFREAIVANLPHAPDSLSTGPETVFMGQLDPHAAYQTFTCQSSAGLELEGIIATHNREVTELPLDIVLFPSAIEHVLRLTRVLRQSMGNALLIGPPSWGRKTAVRLATLALRHQLVYATADVSGYTRDEWLEDLLQVLSTAREGIATTLLLADQHLENDFVLEDLSRWMKTSRLPPQFEIVASERTASPTSSMATPFPSPRPASPSPCGADGNSMVRAKLHFVLCLSSHTETLKRCLWRFPFLGQMFVMDWYDPWPSDTLQLIAETRLMQRQADMTPTASVSNFAQMAPPTTSQSGSFPSAMSSSSIFAIGDGTVASAAAVLLQIFRGVEAELAQSDTADSLAKGATLNCNAFLFFDFIRIFTARCESTMAELAEKRTRYKGALRTIGETEKWILDTNKIVETNRPMVAQLKEKVSEFAAEICETEKQLQAAATELEEAQVRVDKTTETVNSLQRELGEAYAAVTIAVQEAVSSLITSDRRQVVELKTMHPVPEKARRVFEAMCLMFYISPKESRDSVTQKRLLDYINPVRLHILRDVDTFRGLISNYNMEGLSEELFEVKLVPYFKERQFKPEALLFTSKLLAGMIQWIIALDGYYRVSKQVRPLKERLKSEEEALQLHTAELNAKMQAHQKLTTHLAGLRYQHDQHITYSKKLESDTQIAEQKHARALRIMNVVRDRVPEYEHKMEKEAKETMNALGDSLLTAACITFLGAFLPEKREKLLAGWIAQLKKSGVPSSSKKFTLEKGLGASLLIGQWIAGAQLPQDTPSVESALIANNSIRSPFMVDPHGIATRWLKAWYDMQKKPLVVLRESDASFFSALEEAVKKGHCVLIEHCSERMDPSLRPLLRLSGTEGKVLFRKNLLLRHPNFRLYLTTNTPFPQLPVDFLETVVVVNFTVYEMGMTEQILRTIIFHEEREYADKFTRYSEHHATGQEQLHNLELNILVALAGSATPLDSDEVAVQVESLQATKVKVETKINENDQFRKTYARVRARHLVLAQRAGSLFFVVSSLARLSPAYQFSLSWYLSLVATAIAKSARFGDEMSHEERSADITNYFLRLLYRSLSVALYPRDQLILSFLLTAASENVPVEEVRFIALGDTGHAIRSPPQHPHCPSWLPQQAYELVCRASEQLEPFYAFSHDVCRDDTNEFKKYVTRVSMQPPIPANSPLTRAQRLIMVRCLRIDRMEYAVRDYVEGYEQALFRDPPIAKLSAIFEEHKQRLQGVMPIVFMLSPDTIDPVTPLRELAQEKGFQNSLDEVALGPDDPQNIVRLIDRAKNLGRWLLIQNLHLRPQWVPQLVRVIDELSLSKRGVERDFQLWLSTLPAPSISMELYHRGLKVVLEAPLGIRAKMQFFHASPAIPTLSFYNQPDTIGIGWKRACFTLCFFHSVVAERRKFGPVGWHCPYNFTLSDLRTAVSYLQMAMSRHLAAATSSQQGTPAASQRGAPEPAPVPNYILQLLVGQCVYSANLLDPWDAALLDVLAGDFFSSERIQHGVVPLSPLFPTLANGDLSTIETSLEGLPETGKPTLFGLHLNDGAVVDRVHAAELLEGLCKATGSHSAPSSPFTPSNPLQMRADSAKQIESLVVALLARIPEPFDLVAISHQFPTNSADHVDVSAMNLFLCQETSRYNRLCARIRQSLQVLRDAFLHDEPFTPAVCKMAWDLLSGRRPSEWAPFSYPSALPLTAYVDDLLKRTEVFERWVSQGPPPVHWLGCFFLPRAFFTTMELVFCRLLRIPMSSVTWCVGHKMDGPVMAPEVGCYLESLVMLGASWDADKGCLGELPTRTADVELPFMWLYPAEPLSATSAKEFAAAAPTYPCPIYRTLPAQFSEGDDLTKSENCSLSQRHCENHIFTIPLPIPPNTATSHWMKRGTFIVVANR